MLDLISKLIFAVAIAAPTLIFTIKNKFNNPKATFLRAVVAILVGWSLIFAYLLVIQYGLEPQHINGAANAFVSTLGWVIPTTLVLVAWLLKKFLLGLSSKHEI